jgi:hypothetical protein
MSSKSIGVGAPQKSEPLPLEIEAQQVLDELWNEKLIPFQLNVGQLSHEVGAGKYTIHFHDSRIRTALVSCARGQSWKKQVRETVLARVTRMSGPLTAKPGTRS